MALIRAISLAALALRSDCAAEAVGACASTPAPTMARSGFFETVASPLVRIPCAMVVVVVAEGDVRTTEGRFEATMMAATASAHAATIPMGTKKGRICRQNDAPPSRVTRSYRSSGPGHSGGSQPTFGTLPVRQ